MSTILHAPLNNHSHDCIRWKTFSQGSFMQRCTRVYHPSALFFCMVYTCLLANEEKLFFTCSHDWNVLFFRNLSGFDIVWCIFIFLKVSTIPLEVSGFSTVKACELSPCVGSGMWLVPLLWTSLLAPSSARLLCHICLQLRQDTTVLSSCFLIQDTCTHPLQEQFFFFDTRYWETPLDSPHDIASFNENFVVATWFTNPMKVLMWTTMLSPSLYFSLTIFLNREVLFRAFSLSYHPDKLCHIS